MAFLFEKLKVYQKAVDFADQAASLSEGRGSDLPGPGVLRMVPDLPESPARRSPFRLSVAISPLCRIPQSLAQDQCSTEFCQSTVRLRS